MSAALLLDKFGAVAKKDMLTAARYRRAFLVQGVALLLQLASFYYLARAVGPSFRPQGMDYYPFLLLGTALLTFFVYVISGFVEAVHQAQVTGTMEVLMNTSTSPTLVIVLTALSSMLRHLFALALYVAAGLLLFQVPLPAPNVTACALVLALVSAVAVACGVMAAAVQVMIQKGSAVLWLVGAAGSLFTGTMFPVTALPEWMQRISALIPLTHAIDAFRMALLHGMPLEALGGPLAALGVYALVLLPASLWLFAYAIRRARLDGTLSCY